jgi:hypothetical protein
MVSLQTLTNKKKPITTDDSALEEEKKAVITMKSLVPFFEKVKKKTKCY